MQIRILLFLLVTFMLFDSCSEKFEALSLELEQDYQPLAVGNYWIYEVDETLFFGENDSDRDQYFYRDRIRATYVNVSNEVTYVIERSKSKERTVWVLEYEYTMIYRDKILLRTINNQPLVALVFPPSLGRIWNGKVYQAEGNDDFEIDLVGPSQILSFEGVATVRVNQENSDDKITFRDVRYEVFGKGVGLLEKYDEVLTYCSRNDCLGKLLIDGGRKTHLKLVEYGKN